MEEIILQNKPAYCPELIVCHDAASAGYHLMENRFGPDLQDPAEKAVLSTVFCLHQRLQAAVVQEDDSLHHLAAGGARSAIWAVYLVRRNTMKMRSVKLRD